MKKGMKALWLACLAAVLFSGPVAVVKADEGNDGAQQALQMKDKLGLTDEQVAKLKALIEAEKAEYGPLVKQQMADLKTLGEKVKAGAPDAELKPLLDKLESQRQAIENAKTSHIDKARAILNPTQQAKITLVIVARRLAVLKHLVDMKKGK